MKSLLVLFFAAISAVVTIGLCPSLRCDVQAALVEANLLPAAEAAARAPVALTARTTATVMRRRAEQPAAPAVAVDQGVPQAEPETTVAGEPPAAPNEPAA
jgi:hypothetical protein